MDVPQNGHKFNGHFLGFLCTKLKTRKEGKEEKEGNTHFEPLKNLGILWANLKKPSLPP
jgi:hypothetical protein